MARADAVGMVRSVLVMMGLASVASAAPAVTSTTQIRGTAAVTGALDGKVVRQAKLANGGALQLHVLEDSRLAIAMRDKTGAWRTWHRPDLALIDNACGMGKCADEEVESV